MTINEINDLVSEYKNLSNLINNWTIVFKNDRLIYVDVTSKALYSLVHDTIEAAIKIRCEELEGIFRLHNIKIT